MKGPKTLMGFPVTQEDNPKLKPPIVFGDFKEVYTGKIKVTITPSPLFISNLIKAHLESMDEDFSKCSSDVVDSLVDMGMPRDDAKRLVDAMYTKEND